MTLDSPASERRPARVDLSRTPPFRLGLIEVRPASREVCAPGVHAVAEPRVLQVLTALAQAQGDTVSRDVLVQRCWEGRAIGEDAIQRAVAKARRLAELTDPPAFAIESIARVGYRLRVGEAAADVAPPEPAAAPIGAHRHLPRRALLAGVGVAAVAGGAGVAAWRWRAGAGPAAAPRIAVLPFDNLTSDGQLAFMADGLSEDVLNALAKAGGLTVAARESSFGFRGAAKARAAETLKAAYVVDGSVMKRGGRLRVVAHLTDARTDRTLWSETYDRDAAQGFAIEDEVAGAVASALSAKLSVSPSAARPADAVAYELFLRGREASRAHTFEGVREGQTFLKLALERAPNFSQGWAELANAHWVGGFFLPPEAQRLGFAEGRKAAERALELDPRNGQAHAALAMLTPRYNAWGRVDAGLARGLALDPGNATILRWRGDFLQHVGRPREAVDFQQKAETLDPLEPYSVSELYEALLYSRRYREAEAVCGRMTRLFPRKPATFWGRVWLMATSGRTQAAAVLLNDRAIRPPAATISYSVLAQAFLAETTPDRVAAARACLALGLTAFGYANEMVLVLTHLRELDAAAELAETAHLRPTAAMLTNGSFGPGSSFRLWGDAGARTLFHPMAEPLLKSGRLQPVFDGLGLTAYWRATRPPDRF